MIFNGKDLISVHPALSIRDEVPPGMARRQIATIKGTDGEIVSDVVVEAGEYLVRVNIAGRSKKEAWEVRELLAAWAGSSGNRTAELIPTHRPSRCFDAILSSIGDPQFVRGFATVDVRFMLPRPIARNLFPSNASGTGKMTAQVGGSLAARPVIRQTLAESRTNVVWTMDGQSILTLRAGMGAGQVIEMDTRYEKLTIDGMNALALIDPQNTKWRPGYMPGRHEIVSTDSGAMEMRWHNEWL